MNAIRMSPSAKCLKSLLWDVDVEPPEQIDELLEILFPQDSD